MAVSAGRAWNLLADPHTRLETAYERLADWGINSTETFHATVRRLLDEGIDRDVEEVLNLRRVHQARLPDPSAWLGLVQRVSAYPGQVDTTRRIIRYEQAFRRDGVLAPDGLVPSARAYDWGRAISIVHWGLSVGLCDPATAAGIVQYAGRLCAATYGSWAELSAGYSLGRVLRYDDDRFSEEWYGDSVSTHRALATAPDSPWRTLPWPTSVVPLAGSTPVGAPIVESAPPAVSEGPFGYLAMAIGMPSFLLAFLVPGIGGVAVGGLAVLLGLVGRARSIGPAQVRNRFMANVGVLTGTVAMLLGVGILVARSLGR